jgi:ketosteroid isomerase-like protein
MLASEMLHPPALIELVQNEPHSQATTNAFIVRGTRSPLTGGVQEMATNKEFIEHLYECFAGGDVPAVLSGMADDVQWTEADGFPLAGTFVGPQAVLEGVFMRLGEIGDHWSVVHEQFVVDGDTVVTLGTYAWEHKGTGEPASVKMAHVWAIRDGKVAAFQQHVDTARLRELS